MGKVLPDLDLRLSRLQGDYQSHYGSKDYRTAAHMLYQLNANLTEDCRIEDLPKPSSKSDTHEQDLTAEDQYGDYCEEYAPLIFNAIAKFNEMMLKALIKRGGY